MDAMKDMRFDLKSYIESRKQEIDAALDRYLPGEDVYPESLHKAMRYSVFSGGKRFRPILCIACFEACGGEGACVMPVACAIELVHTYSLIHDDLPCMDDDDLRRGKPTSHKVFGEAVAVLAGDALLTHSVYLIATEGAKALGLKRSLQVLEDLMRAIGAEGMVAGQVVDMESEGRPVDEGTLRFIHSRKTGALIAASAESGAIMAEAGQVPAGNMSKYGEKIGLAFQITDDILDAEGKFGELKAGSGLDDRRQKATYPRLYGLEKSRDLARQFIEDAKDSVASFGERALPLMALADLVRTRVS